MNTILEQLEAEILSWEGVIVRPHRFGGIEFQYRGKELGHLHGESIADLLFPRNMRNELVESGRAHPHHIYPDSGWVTRYIRGAEDVPAVIELFRMQYERMKGDSFERSVEPKEQ
ncbi:luciferase family protein [Paenibacillus allorhizosphaerae]|uniref:Luciferase domain-containing protein n=1 Tax=Paenibacillus allorhizosphaerae TaxID=2849866 RepID=A0ABM8VR25_9BACL|nr:luciferase family protein [Paenibacillus allorhizosphaerae]CAG7654677.1 hypothetical protein PAECIP111802_05837 [Paenibacillus allorhizosphaerae]